MICKKCECELLEGAVFCHKCGEKVEALCTSCNKELIVGEMFCSYCGISNSSDLQDDEQDFLDSSNSEEVDETWFANNKSIYIQLDSENVNFPQMSYEGMIYFISESKIWKMNEDSKERQLVAIKDRNDNNPYIGVNRRGIFTYDENYSEGYIYNYSFKGTLINKVKLPTRQSEVTSEIFIFDDKIYYLTIGKSDIDKQDIHSIRIDGTNHILIYEGTKRMNIRRIGANAKGVIFYMQVYINYGVDKIHYFETRGWYKYDFETRETINLNSDILPPHEFLTNPEKFNRSLSTYRTDNDRVGIFSFDLINNIMWTYPSIKEENKMKLEIGFVNRQIFPRKIGLALNQPILKNIKSWTLPDTLYADKSYIFNGERLYIRQDYFCSVYRDGRKSEYWTNNATACKVQLTGKYLIGEIEDDTNSDIGYGERICRYPLTIERPKKDQIIQHKWKTTLGEEIDWEDTDLLDSIFGEQSDE